MYLVECRGRNEHFRPQSYTAQRRDAPLPEHLKRNLLGNKPIILSPYEGARAQNLAVTPHGSSHTATRGQWSVTCCAYLLHVLHAVLHLELVAPCLKHRAGFGGVLRVYNNTNATRPVSHELWPPMTKDAPRTFIYVSAFASSASSAIICASCLADALGRGRVTVKPCTGDSWSFSTSSGGSPSSLSSSLVGRPVVIAVKARVVSVVTVFTKSARSRWYALTRLAHMVAHKLGNQTGGWLVLQPQRVGRFTTHTGTVRQYARWG